MFRRVVRRYGLFRPSKICVASRNELIELNEKWRSMSQGIDDPMCEWSPSADLSRLLHVAFEETNEMGERGLEMRRAILRGGCSATPTTPTDHFPYGACSHTDDADASASVFRPVWATQANIVLSCKRMISHYNAHPHLYAYCVIDTMRLASLLDVGRCLSAPTQIKRRKKRRRIGKSVRKVHGEERRASRETESAASVVKESSEEAGTTFSSSKRRLLAQWLSHPCRYIIHPSTLSTTLGSNRAAVFREKLLTELARYDEVFSEGVPGVATHESEPFKITPVRYSPTIPVACARLGMSAEASRNWMALLRCILAFAPLRASYRSEWLEYIPYIIEDLLYGGSDQLHELLPLPLKGSNHVPSSVQQQRCWRSSNECFECPPLTCVSRSDALAELFMAAATEFGSSYALLIALQLRRVSSQTSMSPSPQAASCDPHSQARSQQDNLGSRSIFNTIGRNAWSEKYGDMQTSRDIQRVLQREQRRQLDWEFRSRGKIRESKSLRFFPE